MKNLINKFASLKGASFISINDYLSSTSGEIANHVVNVNISVKNAKEADLKKLQSVTPADLKRISEKSNFSMDVVSQAYSELLTSAVRNLSAEIEDRSAQSQAQTDAYIFLTPAIRLHKETLTIHVFGQFISKHIIKEADPKKPVKSSDKTLAKKAIKKSLDLRTDFFRDYILGNADMLQVAGDTILIVR
jgi:hypothetical protein